MRPSGLRGEAEAYEFLEHLRWGSDGPAQCPHCGSDKGAWFLRSKDPEGRKSKGGTSARSQRRVWKCRESQCRRQFSVLTKTVMQGTKMPVQSWVEVVYALCSEDAGLSARDISKRWGVAEKSAQLMLDRIQQALERPEAAGASLASNAPLWVRATRPPIETTAQRAKASQKRRTRSADEAASAQVKADVARALTEALGETPAAASANPAEKVKPEPVKPEPMASKPAAAERQSVKRPKPTRRSDVAPAAAPPSKKSVKRAPAQHRPQIDQQQVESDVQRVLAELSETDGLFGEGWLDDEPPARPASDADLGPSWSEGDGS